MVVLILYIQCSLYFTLYGHSEESEVINGNCCNAILTTLKLGQLVKCIIEHKNQLISLMG